MSTETTKTFDITPQEVGLLVEALNIKIQDLHAELTTSRDVGALYWRAGIKDKISNHDHANIKYLTGEIDRNLNLIKKLMDIG